MFMLDLLMSLKAINQSAINWRIALISSIIILIVVICAIFIIIMSKGFKRSHSAQRYAIIGLILICGVASVVGVQSTNSKDVNSASYTSPAAINAANPKKLNVNVNASTKRVQYSKRCVANVGRQIIINRKLIPKQWKIAKKANKHIHSKSFKTREKDVYTKKLTLSLILKEEKFDKDNVQFIHDDTFNNPSIINYL